MLDTEIINNTFPKDMIKFMIEQKCILFEFYIYRVQVEKIYTKSSFLLSLSRRFQIK